MEFNGKTLTAFGQFDVPVGDFVEEQGVKDGWIYRKWYSGIAECLRKEEIFCDGTPAYRIGLPIGFTEEPIMSLNEEFIEAFRFVGHVQFVFGQEDGLYTNCQIAVQILELSSQAQATVSCIESTERFTVRCIGKWK